MTSASWRDAWILLAVAWANRGDKCDLASVLEAAVSPWRNRPPPTVEELEQAVRRLLPAGLLHVSSECYELTAEGRTLCDEATARLLDDLPGKGSFDRHVDWLAARLEALLQHQESSWSLDPRLHEEAMQLNPKKKRAWPAAWIFAAVAWANNWGRCDLPGVFFAADAINHSKPRVREVEDAVRRLVPAGLLDVSGDCFRLTARGTSLWAEASAGSGSVFDALDWLRVRLGSLPEQPAFEWSLDSRVHEEAWDRYSEESRRLREESKSRERRERES
jgi:hypothetical protein